MTKYCGSCKLEHPYTDEYWHFGKRVRCKISANRRSTKYRENNLEKSNSYSREWRKNNPSKTKEYHKNGKKTKAHHYYNLINSAKKRKIEVLITKEEYKDILDSNPTCTYCDIELVTGYGINLDRIDSSRGYFVDNVVPCCKVCNIAKSTLTVQEFKSWVLKVYNKLTSSPTWGSIENTVDKGGSDGYI